MYRSFSTFESYFIYQLIMNNADLRFLGQDLLMNYCRDTENALYDAIMNNDRYREEILDAFMDRADFYEISARLPQD